jgi:hypothetical protein
MEGLVTTCVAPALIAHGRQAHLNAITFTIYLQRRGKIQFV